jgi:hypothetical protein
MKTRDAVLCYQEVQASDKSTKTIDLDIVDPVSAIGFEFEAVGGTTSNRNNPLYHCITKLEVVDGSDVLASLSFEEAQALQFYKTGKQPQLRLDENASLGDVIGCMLLFGRHLYDREYALDLTKFANPQLKISWDLAKIRALNLVSAWKTGSLMISAWAKVMEGQASPGKFFMDKEIEAWTGGASGDKRHELPVDHPYRMLMLQTWASGMDVDIAVTNLKMTCDTDKYIPLDRKVKQLDAEMAQLFGNCIVWKRACASNTDTVMVPVYKEPQVRFVVPATDRHAWYTYCWSGEVYLNLETLAAVAVTTDERVDMTVEGHSLHCTLPIPLGVMDEPDTWFDPTVYKKFELITTEASATANALVSEQVRPN